MLVAFRWPRRCVDIGLCRQINPSLLSIGTAVIHLWSPLDCVVHAFVRASDMSVRASTTHVGNKLMIIHSKQWMRRSILYSGNIFHMFALRHVSIFVSKKSFYSLRLKFSVEVDSLYRCSCSLVCHHVCVYINYLLLLHGMKMKLIRSTEGPSDALPPCVNLSFDVDRRLTRTYV